ncbi:MAG: methyltransferase domain-containing protein [bacterium]
MKNNKLSNSITDRIFWKSYWSNYKPKIVNRVMFDDIFKTLADNKSFIEIGGFPGTFSVYMKKYKGYEVSLLDYYIDEKIVREMERINSIKEESIQLIETEFISYKTDKKYDVVFSSGFIEHFQNLEIIYKKHYEITKKGGIMLISLPNFLGLNGFVQKYFDNKNYDAHNLEAMKIENIKKILNSLNLKYYKILYYGKPGLWLEKTAKVKKYTRFVIKLISQIIKILPLKNKILSTRIVIIAKK